MKLLVLIPLLLQATAARAAQSNEFICESYYWGKRALDSSYTRPRTDPPDSFRVIIESSTSIRIRGSDHFRNGQRRVRKEGTRYYFLDEEPYENSMGTITTPTGRSYFDPDEGKIERFARSPFLLGTKIEQWWEGSCD